VRSYEAARRFKHRGVLVNNAMMLLDAVISKLNERVKVRDSDGGKRCCWA
jgi:hypothetical protein